MSRSSRIAVWDGWRGLAVLLVLIGHFTFSQWVWEERMGVDVFFVLSGMLMSNILFVERMGLRDFYIRRFSRIMPALVVFLCAALVVSLVLKYEFQLIEFFASLVFIRTYFPVDPQYMSNLIPTGHLWSLSVEEHSYVAMSLLSIIFLLRIRIAWVLLSLFGISVIVNFYHYVNLPLEEFKYSLYRTESAMGFIAFSAGYNLIRDKYSLKVNPYLPILFLVLAFCCYIKWVPIWTTFLIAPVLLGVAVNHLQESARALQAVLSFAPLRYFGVLSYSIYLWQQIFYNLHYALPYGQVTGFFLSIVIGAGSFYIIENPVRRYINARWSPSPTYRSAS